VWPKVNFQNAWRYKAMTPQPRGQMPSHLMRYGRQKGPSRLLIDWLPNAAKMTKRGKCTKFFIMLNLFHIRGYSVFLDYFLPTFLVLKYPFSAM
jgi:hypothetical protein